MLHKKIVEDNPHKANLDVHVSKIRVTELAISMGS